MEESLVVDHFKGSENPHHNIHCLTQTQQVIAVIEDALEAEAVFYTSCSIHISITTTNTQHILLQHSKHINQSCSEFTCSAVEGVSHPDRRVVSLLCSGVCTGGGDAHCAGTLHPVDKEGLN